MSAPSLDEARERFSFTKTLWNQWLLNALRYKDAYMQVHWESELEEGDYQATLPLETLVIDTALSILTSNLPLYVAVPQDETSEYQAALADRVERWHMGIDSLNDLAESSEPRVMALFESLLYGLGWIREVADFPADWGEKEYTKEDLSYRPLFIQTLISPKQVFFRKGRFPGGLRLLGYESLYTVADIESEWGITLRLLQDEKGRFLPKDPFEKRRLIDYWEWIMENHHPILYHGVFILDPMQWVKRPVSMNEYKRIPYYPITCYETNEDKPEDRYLSFLFKLKELPHLAEVVVSRELRMAEMYVDPIIVIKKASGQEIPFIKAPGAVLEIGVDESASYLQYTGTAPDLPRVRELILNLAHEASFSSAILSQGTGETVAGRITDVEQGLFKIVRPALNYKRTLEQMLWHRAQLAYTFSPDTAIPAWGEDAVGRAYSIKLTGKQLLRYSNIHVRIRPHVPGQMLAEINIATQALNSKVWDLNRAMDFLGEQDRQTIRRGIKRDMIEFSEEAVALEKQLYLRDLQKELQEELSQEEGEEPGIGGEATPAGGGGPMQPFTQGIQNSLQNVAAGGAQGQAANPTSPIALAARRMQRQANQGRPTSRGTLGGG